MVAEGDAEGARMDELSGTPLLVSEAVAAHKSESRPCNSPSYTPTHSDTTQGRCNRTKWESQSAGIDRRKVNTATQIV